MLNIEPFSKQEAHDGSTPTPRGNMREYGSRYAASRDGVDWELLVEKARRGDDQAFAEICNQMATYLRLIASDIGQGLQGKFSSSDIIQKTLLEACQGISQFRGSTQAELTVWLGQLVRNNLIDSTRLFTQTQMRDLSREQEVVTDDHIADYAEWHRTASSLMSQRETDDELLKAMEQLSGERRRIIQMRIWQSLSFAEVATRLKTSEGTARQLFSRALNDLRTKLTTNHARRPR